MAAKAKNSGPKSGEKRVTVRTETVEERDEGGELELEPAGGESEEGDDFLSVLADLAGGSEARCEIRRTSPAEFAGYCCTYALSEMSLDRLQEEWGGGKFSVRVRNGRGEFKGSASVQIAGKARNRGDAPAVVSQPAAAPAVDIGALLTAATAGSKQQIDMLTSLVTALINKPAPAPPPAGPDVLDVIAQLAPLLKPDKGGSDSADSVKLLLQGIELGKDLGGAGGEAGFTDVIMKGLDTVKGMVPAAPPPGPPAPRQPRPAAQRVAQPRIPAPGSVPAQEPPKPPTQATAPRVDPGASPMLRLLQWLKQQTVMLCHQAQRGKDPELYAELLLDNLPAGLTEEEMLRRMQSPGAIDDLAQINPNVLHFREWFEEFRLAVIDLLTDDGEEESDEGDPLDAGEALPDSGGEVIDHIPDPPNAGGEGDEPGGG